MGDIVVLKDHIDFTGNSPLIGSNFEEFGDRFPNMENVYDYVLRKKALDVAKNFNIKAKMVFILEFLDLPMKRQLR
jgi:purine-nucleoside phosphorylase